MPPSKHTFAKNGSAAERMECFKDLEKCISVFPSVDAIQTLSVGGIWGEQFHRSSTHELIHVLEGHATIRCHGSSFQVSPGDVFIIPARTMHKDIAETDNYRVNYVFFRWPVEHEKIIQALKPSVILGVPAYFKTRLKILMKELVSEYSNNVMHVHEHLNIIVLQIILTLLRYSRRKEKKIKTARRMIARKRQRDLAREVKNHLQQHYSEVITLDALASQLKTSPFYLSRIYSNEFGISIFEDLIMIRISSAKELLKRNTLSIKEISTAVGFSDSNYFAKVFRKVEGLSPTEFQLKVLE
jgi:AraC family transcriptional regulator, arabinose operon regulatory protein